MLTPEQISVLRDMSGQLVDPIVEFLIADIADRISEAGQFTSTASYEVWKVQKLGLSQKEIKKELQKRLKVSSAQIEQLLTQAAEVGYDFDLKRFPSVDAIPFDDNESLQQILNAAIQQAQEDFTNLTQTMGFVGPDGRFLELTDAYQRACDFAFEKVTTGAQDYTSAVRDATRGLAEKGIRVLDYASGVHRSIEAATRQNVMGGLGIMVEQISQQNHDMLGCDGWEISAHAGCAPDHEPIQGKQYSDEEYTRLNNSLVRRIGTLNCGHSTMPVILGVNEPQYTAEELEEMRQKNEEGITYNGKHYTLYEAEQRQHTLERAIRERKHRILLDEHLGDKDKLQTDQIRLQLLKQEYSRFSKAAGLPMQYERMEAAGFTWKHGKAAEQTAVRVKREKAAEKTRLAAEAARKGSAAVASATSTPAANPMSGNRSFVDITGAWYPDAKPNSHPVVDLQEYAVDGVTYKVDGQNVQLDYKPYEKEIAELLEREVGGEIFMVPRVNNPQGVKTPDFLFHGKGYDLKTLHNPKGKNPIFNRIQNAKGQSKNFILDLTDAGLDEDFIQKQLEKVFSDKSTEFVDEVVVIRNGKIEKVLKRQKKS